MGIDPDPVGDDDDTPPETPRSPSPLGMPRPRPRPLASISLEELAGVVASADSLVSKLVELRTADRRELDGYRGDVQACTKALDSASATIRETFDGWKAHAERLELAARAREAAAEARFSRLEEEIGEPAPEDAPTEGKGIRGTLSILVRELRTSREHRLAGMASRAGTGIVGGGSGALIFKLLEGWLS